MTLTLTYQADTRVPVEIEGLTPDGLRASSLAEVERAEIFHGNRKLPLAEMFQYATKLRTLTQGRSSWSMEPASYEPMPPNLQTELLRRYGYV